MIFLKFRDNRKNFLTFSQKIYWLQKIFGCRIFFQQYFFKIFDEFYWHFFGNFSRFCFETFDHNVNVNNGVVFCVTGRRQKNCGRNWTSLSNIYGYVFKMTCRQAVASSSVYLDSSQNEVTSDPRFYLNLMCHQNSWI